MADRMNGDTAEPVQDSAKKGGFSKKKFVILAVAAVAAVAVIIMMIMDHVDYYDANGSKETYTVHGMDFEVSDSWTPDANMMGDDSMIFTLDGDEEGDIKAALLVEYLGEDDLEGPLKAVSTDKARRYGEGYVRSNAYYGMDCTGGTVVVDHAEFAVYIFTNGDDEDKIDAAEKLTAAVMESIENSGYENAREFKEEVMSVEYSGSHDEGTVTESFHVIITRIYTLDESYGYTEEYKGPDEYEVVNPATLKEGKVSKVTVRCGKYEETVSIEGTEKNDGWATTYSK